MQFLVVARDGSDEGAVERRQRTRPTHLASIAPLVEGGQHPRRRRDPERGRRHGRVDAPRRVPRPIGRRCLARGGPVRDRRRLARGRGHAVPHGRRRLAAVGDQPVALATARIAMSSLGSPGAVGEHRALDAVDDLRRRTRRRRPPARPRARAPRTDALFAAFLGDAVGVEDQRVAGSQPDLLIGELRLFEDTEEGAGPLDPLARSHPLRRIAGGGWPATHTHAITWSASGRSRAATAVQNCSSVV